MYVHVYCVFPAMNVKESKTTVNITEKSFAPIIFKGILCHIHAILLPCLSLHSMNQVPGHFYLYTSPIKQKKYTYTLLYSKRKDKYRLNHITDLLAR